MIFKNLPRYTGCQKGSFKGRKNPQFLLEWVKIKKSAIISQICQLEVYKLVKPENKLKQAFYNTFQAFNCFQNLFLASKSEKYLPRANKFPVKGSKSQNRQ